MRDLLVLSKWFDGLETAPQGDLKEIGYRIVKIVLGKENEIDSSDDVYPMSKIWKDIEKNALGTYDAYMEKKKFGEEHGRKMDPASIMAWQYCQLHPKASANEVGEYLYSQGVLEKGSEANKKGPFAKVYDLEGWKERKNSDWEFGRNSENSIGIQERNPNGTPIF